MRYIVDGYNLLFRLSSSTEELQEQRLRFLRLLREKVSLIEVAVTVVFDAYYQQGEAIRSDLGPLEIIYTNERETADNCILDLLKVSSDKAIVVTSDKALARLARQLGAKTETAEEFLSLLNKRYQNRLKRVKKEVKPKKKIEVAPPAIEKPSVKKRPGKNASFAECFDYYLQAFEENP